ncbi:hypothetical protein [Streptomyces carpinensis]|uniref:Uncharacterized protein n=1 Tax=Streptomyces carpinensis TaxID=66369 RepID=A0ABV1W7G7_9ACTN|nr:hypothetical protein [Streptomyces carpinensis]
MESGPAIFTGAVFALFGVVLLGWTAVRVRHREPVALGVHQITAATAASVIGLGAVALGAWCFSLQ